MNLFILLIVVVSFITLYIFTHLRPLTDSEISSLAKKKRRRRIRKYFTFNYAEYNPNKEFKKRMNPNGSFYNIDELLYDFPSIASSLLKYKKHEWIIIGFEREKKIQSIWLNKGFDRASVSSYLSAERIANIGIRDKNTSILIFHNHPNSNPNQFNCSNPSNQDLISARIYAKVFNVNGLNLIEFVCERGKHYEYFRFISDSFYPQSDVIQEINIINGVSKTQNLVLHLQRIF